MDTKELIRGLRVAYDNNVTVNKEYLEGVLQKLLEYGELKKMLTNIIDPLIEAYEFVLADLDEDE